MSQPENRTLTDRWNTEESWAEERDLEAPDADAVEQARAADPNDDAAYEESTVPDSIEVPEWDALEQAQVVQLEDDYR
jgi:hypothetical protein